jgi:bla regulator protein BlaR1
MIPPYLFPLLNHLWQSTFVAGAAALFAWGFRKNSASVRYRLWLGASIKFLIPFSLFISAGAQFQ